MDLYEELGAPRDASQDEIKKAYRKASQKHHPDREGGNTEKFQAINAAYEILSDVERRERYDRTGEIDKPMDYRTMAIQYLSGLFSELMESALEFDIIEKCNLIINNKIVEISDVLKRQKKQLDKLEKLRLRVAKKNGSESIFTLVADQKINITKTAISALETQNLVMDEIITLLGEHQDNEPKKSPNLQMGNNALYDAMMSGAFRPNFFTSP